MNAQTALAERSPAPAPLRIVKTVDHDEAKELGTATYYEFREVTDANELEQTFRLRYRVYRACELSHFLPQNEHKLDIDAYDLRSHHYGLFFNHDGESQVVGCVRVVTDHETAAAPAVRLIAGAHRHFAQVASQSPREVFPLLEYAPCRTEVLSLYHSCRERGKEIVEAGRLALDPAHQCQHLGALLVQAAAAAVGFLIGQYGYALVTANQHASRFYRVGGFGKIPGAIPFHVGRVRQPFVCLIGTVGSIPASSRPTVERYAAELRATGRIRIGAETKPKPAAVAPAPQAAITHFEFREVTDAAGLRDLFRLRYRCFRDSKLSGLIPENSCELDIDAYDLRARHFGLFEYRGSDCRLVGNHRYVYDCEQSAAAAIRQLVAECPELQARVLTSPQHPFPVLEYWPDKEPIYDYYRAAKARGEVIIEGSRLALDPSIDSLAVVNFVFQATVASYQALGGTRAITAFNSDRKRFYSRFGFTVQTALPDRFIESANMEGAVLYWDNSHAASPIRSRIDSLKSEYQLNHVLRLEVHTQGNRSNDNE